MKPKANPIAAAVSQFLMKAALPLGAYFIAEYMVSVLATGNVLLAMLRLAMAAATPVALFFMLRTLRDRILGGYIRGRHAWLYGVQAMIFAALIEAAFIYIYNEFLVPDNLAQMQQAALAQFDASRAALESMPAGGSASVVEAMGGLVEEMRHAPVPTAIEAAVSQLSNDFMVGMVLMLAVAPMVRRHKAQG